LIEKEGEEIIKSIFFKLILIKYANINYK